MQSCELINNISGPHCLSYYLVLCDFYTMCQLTLDAVLYSVLMHISCCYNLCQFTLRAVYTLCKFTLRAVSRCFNLDCAVVHTLCEAEDVVFILSCLLAILYNKSEIGVIEKIRNRTQIYHA